MSHHDDYVEMPGRPGATACVVAAALFVLGAFGGWFLHGWWGSLGC